MFTVKKTAGFWTLKDIVSALHACKAWWEQSLVLQTHHTHLIAGVTCSLSVSSSCDTPPCGKKKTRCTTETLSIVEDCMLPVRGTYTKHITGKPTSLWFTVHSNTQWCMFRKNRDIRLGAYVSQIKHLTMKCKYIFAYCSHREICEY